MLTSASRWLGTCASFVGLLFVACWSGNADATSCAINPDNPFPVDGATDVPTNVVPTFHVYEGDLEEFDISLEDSSTGEPVDIAVTLVEQSGALHHLVVTPAAELAPHTGWTLHVVEPIRDSSLTVEFTTGDGPDHDAPAVPVLEKIRRYSSEFVFTAIPPEPVAYLVEVSSDESFSDADDLFLTTNGKVYEDGEVIFRVGSSDSSRVPTCSPDDIILDDDQVWTRVAAVSSAGVMSAFSEPAEGSRVGCASAPGPVGAMGWLVVAGLVLIRRRLHVD